MFESIKKLSAIAAAMISTRFVQTLSNFIVMLVLATLGQDVLAASLTISMFDVVIKVICMAPLFAIGALVSRQFGEKRYEQLPLILTQSWYAALIVSIPAMMVFAFSGPILVFFHQPNQMIPMISHFFWVRVPTMPLLYFTVVNQQYLASIKKQHWVLYLSIFLLFNTAFLVYGFTLGHFGLPRFGVTGAALGSLCSIGLSSILSFILVYKANTQLNITTQKVVNWQWLKMIFKIGLPIAVQIASEMIALLLIIIMIGWLGEVAMPSSQISSQYMLFAIIPIFGLAEASTITVGHALGEQRSDLVKQLGYASILLCMVLTLTIALIFGVFHQDFAKWFIHFNHPNSDMIYQLSMWLLLIRIVAMFGDSIADVITGALRGLYDTQYPMIIGIISHWVISLPLALILCFELHLGIYGIAIGAGIARYINMFAILYRWFSISHLRPV